MLRAVHRRPQRDLPGRGVDGLWRWVLLPHSHIGLSLLSWCHTHNTLTTHPPLPQCHLRPCSRLSTIAPTTHSPHAIYAHSCSHSCLDTRSRSSPVSDRHPRGADVVAVPTIRCTAKGGSCWFKKGPDLKPRPANGVSACWPAGHPVPPTPPGPGPPHPGM